LAQAELVELAEVVIMVLMERIASLAQLLLTGVLVANLVQMEMVQTVGQVVVGLVVELPLVAQEAREVAVVAEYLGQDLALAAEEVLALLVEMEQQQLVV